MKKIPNISAKTNSRIPANATNVRDQIDPEWLNFVINFSNYLERKCWIDEFDKLWNCKNAIKQLKKMGTVSLHELVPRDTLENNPRYWWLYSWLTSPEIKIKEIAVSWTGRIFYYVVWRTIYIRSIKGNHVDLH